MIFDGWNKTHVARDGVYHVCYRPMLKQERTGMLAMASLENRESWKLIDIAIYSHIEYIEGTEEKSIVSFLDKLRDSYYEEWELLVSVIMGTANAKSDIDFFDGLQKKVSIHLLYEKLLDSSCSTCCKYIYDPRTAEFTMVGGKRARRQPEDTLLCKTRGGCPKGTYDNPLSWTDKERQVYRHDLECRKANQWPDDPIVMACKASIDMAYEKSKESVNGI